MKTSLLSIVMALSVFYISGCVSTRQTEVNRVGKAEAIQIASQLTFGMREEDALHFLHQNGFTIEDATGGDSFGWSHRFPLLNVCYLDLDIAPKPVSPDGAMRKNGRLEAVHIRNYCDNDIATIKLKNAP